MSAVTKLLVMSLLLTAALGEMPRAVRAQSAQWFEMARQYMVDKEVAAAGVRHEGVLASMRVIPRHEFVPRNLNSKAYLDMALPIGSSQTISPPFVVAYMTEQLDPRPTDKVLEIGTGSGYQSAVLSPLVKEVYSIEIVEALGRRAGRTLRRLRYENVHTKIGDGFLGWPEHAPFDKIIVTCSPERVPRPLVEQLREGGRMVIPLGERFQQALYLYRKQDGELQREALLPTLFVPMTGEAESRRLNQPDPLNPKIVNGGFEEMTEDSQRLSNWHYQRQFRVVEDDNAPEGQHYVTFSNTQPGQGAQALQGFAIDGSAIRELEVSLSMACKNVRPGQNRSQLPLFAVMFYDDQRALIHQSVLGPWQGNSSWEQIIQRIVVPTRAREAIVRIGLFGATGDISFDEVEITVTRRKGK
jgi:protein-L-isoaspartate(D-aspartate) O-methyltransferase